MESKTLKRIGNIVVLKDSSLQILQNMKIDGGELSMTNLDTYFKCKTDISESCLVRFSDFSKSGSFENSIASRCDTKEYPEWPDLKDKRDLPVEIFNRSYKSLLNYASSDKVRQTLMNVNFQRDYAVWATDGHRVAIDDAIKSPVNISVPREFILLLDILLSVGEQVKSVCVSNAYSEDKKYSKAEVKAIEKKRKGLSAKIAVIEKEKEIETSKPYEDICSEKVDRYRDEICKLEDQRSKLPDLERAEFACRYKYICVETDNCVVVSKMEESFLPAIKKVLPNIKKSYKVPLSAENLKVLGAAIRVLYPWANTKTHLVVFKNDLVYCINRDRDKAFKIKFPFAIAPECRAVKDAEGKETQEPYPLIGFNAEYFLQMLADIDEDGSLCYGESQLSGMYIKGKGSCAHMLMPLRVMDEAWHQEDMDNAKELPVPSIEKKSVKDQESGYCLFVSSGLYGVRKADAVEQGSVVRKLSDKEYRALAKMGVVAQ